jgi:hypothetical protein
MSTMSEAATVTHVQHPAPFRRVLRSIGAVLAGILANIVFVGAIDAALRAARVYPPMFEPMAEQQWALALSYRIIFAVVGGFLTAWLAVGRPMLHVVVLGSIETVLSLSFVLLNWNNPVFGPHWFGIIAVIMCLPCGALGGILHAKRAARVSR